MLNRGKRRFPARAVAQLEDFNTKRSAEDDEYNKEYMRRMAGEGGMGDFHAPGDDDEDYDDDEEAPEQKQKLSRAEKRKLEKDKRKKEDAETVRALPGRLRALSVFPMQIGFVRCFCMGARGA